MMLISLDCWAFLELRVKVEILCNTAFTTFHQDWRTPSWAVIAGQDLDYLTLLLSDSIDFQDDFFKLLEVNIPSSMIPGEEYYISRTHLDSKDYLGMILASDFDFKDDGKGLYFSKEVRCFDDRLRFRSMLVIDLGHTYSTPKDL